MKLKCFSKDYLTVKIYPNRTEMGRNAAKEIKQKIVELLQGKDSLNMIFAAAPSQNEVLDALVNDSDILWDKINAFHMDEYIGLSADAPQGFGNFLRRSLFSRVPFKSVQYIDCTAKNSEKEAERYATLLKEYPADIVVLGIGENGHIAFNDPDVADFNDEKAVKVVKLDEICRNQQVNDGCFSKIDDVPTHAITLTVPTLMEATWAFCIVPAKTKAKAVEATVNGEISEKCPASILRTKQNAVLYLDNDSSNMLQEVKQ